MATDSVSGFLEKQAELLMRPDAGILYEDDAHLNGISVEVRAENSARQKLLNILVEYGCQVELHNTDGALDTLEAALAEGTETTVLVNSN